MNSSANQISPIALRLRSPVRAWPNVNTSPVTPWKFRPGPAASGAEYAVNGPVYARRKAGHGRRPGAGAAWPLVELRKPTIDRVAGYLAVRSAERVLRGYRPESSY